MVKELEKITSEIINKTYAENSNGEYETEYAQIWAYYNNGEKVNLGIISKRTKLI